MRARWSLTIAAVVIGAGALALVRRRSGDGPNSKEAGGWSEAQVDEAVEESFPASDPPSWTLGERAEP